MAKIVLIDCEYRPPDKTGGHHKNYDAGNHSEPLGLEYLQAYLEKHGHDVDILQLPDENFELKIKKAAVIGFSVLTYQWSLFKELANKTHKLNPAAILVAGREHPTAMPELCLRKTPINYVVCGEGEIPMLQIANGISPEKIPGIAYWKGKKIITNPRPLRLKEWPNAKRDADQMTVTLNEWLPLGNRAAGMMLSRGCCFNCGFCTKQQMWGSRYFCRNIDAVIDEIADIQNRYNISLFAFHDLMFPPKILEKFCRRILQRKIRARFFTMMSATTDMINWRLVRQAGFFEIGVGLEVPNDQRGIIGKKHPFATARNFINSIANAGILTRVYTIIGWLNETNAESVVNSYLGGLSEIAAHILRVHFLTPFPGTKIWNDYKDNFIYPVPEGFSRFTTMEPVLKFKLGAEELLRAREEIIKKYYNSAYFLKIYGKLRAEQKKMVDVYMYNIQ